MDPQRTSETFTKDGWLFSGDLGVLDSAGYLRVVGRKKDIINRGGLKVSAREVEEMIAKHFAVYAVALVGVPDRRLGEKSCAFIVVREGKTITFDALIHYLNGLGIAKYKLPEYFQILKELPMTPTGKIQKFKLKADFVASR